VLYKNLFEFEEKECVDIVRSGFRDDSGFNLKMQEICKVLGLVLDPDFLTPLISGHVAEFVSKSSFKSVENLFVVLESVIAKQPLRGIQKNLRDIIGVFL